MSEITFRWQLANETPELLMAVGRVTLTWARVDSNIMSTLQPFWFDHFPDERMPQSFDRRIRYMVDFVTPLYADEPDEYRIFRWFIQRLTNANACRDAITHGINGTVTTKRKTFEGLRIPFPSKPDKFMAMSIPQINRLADTLAALEGETIFVSSALSAVRDASLQNKSVWRDPDGWTKVTMENRSPMLPRDRPPAFNISGVISNSSSAPSEP